MRVLMMIANSNMVARELYTAVLSQRYPGWGISHMSGLPASPANIIRSYDVLIYELSAPDDPARYRDLKALWEELKPLEAVKVITHIEGPYRDGVAAELEEQGVIVVGAPFEPRTIAEALARAAPRRRAPDQGAARGGLLRGIFRRKE